MAKLVNDKGLETAIVETKGFLVTYFFQVESIPCTHYLPEFVGLSELLKDRATFVSIEVTENPTAAREHGVDCVPTTIIWLDGKDLARYEGPYSREALKNRILDLMKKASAK
jgi:thioredoxin-like negative regulator of GroEL